MGIISIRQKKKEAPITYPLMMKLLDDLWWPTASKNHLWEAKKFKNQRKYNKVLKDTRVCT